MSATCFPRVRTRTSSAALAVAFAVTILSSKVVAQSTVAFPLSVGPTQVVPDPLGGTAGVAALFGIFSPATATAAASLRFTVNGIPTGYGSIPPSTQELILFVIDIGVPSAGTPVPGGGMSFLPVPQVVPSLFIVASGPGVSASRWLGPLDTVPTGGTFGGVQNPLNNGARLDLSNLFVPAAIGVNVTIQGALSDPTLGALFTTNAILFQVQ
jgi:hypothetical protein